LSSGAAESFGQQGLLFRHFFDFIICIGDPLNLAPFTFDGLLLLFSVIEPQAPRIILSSLPNART
jgi:hypothetical protein